MADELPPFVPASRKQALQYGAALIEREIQQLRARALHLDGHPYMAQYKIEPVAGQAESIMLEVLHKAQCATILRDLAEAEQ